MNKREMVIDKARELFTRYGYKKVSMDEIARNAGVTKKTIYSYFKDKEAMFRYFIDEEIEKMKSKIDIGKNNGVFLENVSNSLYAMLLFRKNSALLEVIAREVRSSDDNNNSYLKLYDDVIINYLEEKIKLGIREKSINKCDPHLTAFIIYKMYLAVMFEYDGEIDESKVTKEITSILKNGLIN